MIYTIHYMFLYYNMMQYRNTEGYK